MGFRRGCNDDGSSLLIYRLEDRIISLLRMSLPQMHLTLIMCIPNYDGLRWYIGDSVQLRT